MDTPVREEAKPSLVLNSAVPERARAGSPLSSELQKASEDATQAADFISPLLTKFYGREMHIRAWVILFRLDTANTPKKQLPNRLLDARIWRRPDVFENLRPDNLRAYGPEQNAFDDLGDARRISANGYA